MVVNRERNKDGTFKTSEQLQEESNKRREKKMRDMGFLNHRNPMDAIQEHTDLLRKYQLMPKENKSAFTKDFWSFIGFGIPRDYRWPLPLEIKTQVEDMFSNRFPTKYNNVKNQLTLDYANFYTPLDDMYGDASGDDLWYEYGRVPVSHLMALCSKRIGVAFAACNRPARDVFDNGFEIVKRDDPEGDPLNDNEVVKEIMKFDRITKFQRKLVEIVDYCNRSGLGHLAVDEYEKEDHNSKKWISGGEWSGQAPSTRPKRFQTFSAEFMTPINVYETKYLDYNRDKWDFRGGLHGKQIHHSRTYPLELYREEVGLRGLALPELCFTSCMCYLNMAYYILKGLSQLGTYTVGIQSVNPVPTTAETEAYLENLDLMKANNFFVMGSGASLVVENTASKLGQGINEIMEFYKEDMSAAWCFPKNQLFGRAQGGGLEGAGAIVSKEDYLGSNLSPLMSIMSYETMWILENMCQFDGLEDKQIRFNIDAHKTEGQRLDEEIMRQQLEQQKVITSQVQLEQKLHKKQVALQVEMQGIQMEMLKKDPEKFLSYSKKDEENLEEGETKSVKKDFNEGSFDRLLIKYNVLYKQLKETNDMLGYIKNETKRIMINNARDFKASMIRREREKKYGD